MLKIGAVPPSLVLLGLDETSCEFKQHFYKLSVEWLVILIEYGKAFCGERTIIPYFSVKDWQ